MIEMIKKICFFNSFFTTHGQDRAAYAEKFLPKNIELFLLTLSGQNKYNLRRTEIIEIKGNKLALIFGLRKFCKREGINLLINLGNPQEAFALFLASLFSKTEYIINIVSDIWNRPRVQEKIKDKIFLYAQNLFFPLIFLFSKKTVFCSKDIERKTKKYLAFLKKKIISTPLITSEKLFSPKNQKKLRKKLKIPLQKKIILFIGRIDYLKGSDILFSLIKKNPDKLFILVGRILDEKFINEKLTNVILVPFLDHKNLVNYYNCADLFILPSRVEGYGLVPREAMLCRTPALVSDIPSLRLIPGAIKAKLNEEDFQKKIDKFFSLSKKEREEVGRKSRKLIIKECSYDVLAKRHKDAVLG